MKVKLKVLNGSNAGQEIVVPTRKCLIGRDDECDLRPNSDAVSRRHCAILVKEGRVIVRDLNSKNGTWINGQTIQHERVVECGDSLQVGPLTFKILIEHGLQGTKKPPVKSIKEAAERSICRGQDSVTIDESDISDWLEEPNQTVRERRLRELDTCQLKLDETDEVLLREPSETRSAQDARSHGKEKRKDKKQKKEKFGKLPTACESPAEDSSEAAMQALRKYLHCP